jgi:hypothetical protein
MEAYTWILPAAFVGWGIFSVLTQNVLHVKDNDDAGPATDFAPRPFDQQPHKNPARYGDVDGLRYSNCGCCNDKDSESAPNDRRQITDVDLKKRGVFRDSPRQPGM